jgi:hypothetical protein
LIDSLLDMTLNGIRYEVISSSILLLINEPSTRIYFRANMDLNKIFSIFTMIDGNTKELKREVQTRLEQQLQLAKKSIGKLKKIYSS